MRSEHSTSDLSCNVCSCAIIPRVCCTTSCPTWGLLCLGGEGEDWETNRAGGDAVTEGKHGGGAWPHSEWPHQSPPTVPGQDIRVQNSPLHVHQVLPGSGGGKLIRWLRLWCFSFVNIFLGKYDQIRRKYKYTNEVFLKQLKDFHPYSFLLLHSLFLFSAWSSYINLLRFLLQAEEHLRN